MPTPKPRTETPSAAEFGLLRAFLAQNRVRQAEIKGVIGGNVDGRDRAAIVAQLREWLKDRPKAGAEWRI